MMFSVSTPAVLGRRACAALAAFSAGLHGLMVGETGNLVVGGIVLAMAAACLYCARELWVGSTVRAWCLVALMNLGMIAIHWSAPGCHPAAASVSPAQASMMPPSTLMLTATAVAAVEAVIATIVLSVMTRGRAATLCLGRGELA
jgi:hypothetical protein